MRSIWIVLALVACTHGGGNTQTIPAAAWNAPANLAHVPADTPYVIAMLEPPSPAVRAALWAPVHTRVVAALDQAAKVTPEERTTLSGDRRTALALMDQLRGTDSALWWENLGFASGGHWVLYGLGVSPVLRIDVADASKLRSIVARAAPLLPKAVAKQFGGVAYWQIVNESGDAIIFAVLEHEAVAAVIPERALDRMLPLVLGTQLPQRSLRSVHDLPDVIARHRLQASLVGSIDSARVAAALASAGSPLGGSEVATPACRDDLARIASAIPRVVFGYRALEPKRLDGVFAFELDPAIARQLAKLHVSLPALPANALLATSIGLDVDGLIALARGWRTAIAARPFTCPVLATLGRDLLDATKAIERPLPPEAHGLRGLQVVVDDARPDPPSGSGHAIVVGDQISIALIHALRQLPGMQNVQVGPDGRPYELPLGPLFTMAGIPPLPSFVAMRAGRAALAVGGHARDDVTAALGAPNRDPTPMFELAWHVEQFKARFPEFFEGDNSLLAGWSTLVLTADLEADALVLDATATWR